MPDATEITIPPSHPLLADNGHYDPNWSKTHTPIASVRVSLGVVEAARRGLPGVHVPCVLYYRRTDGRTLGTGAHSGFVVELPREDLEAVGFTVDAVDYSLGAEVGTHRDTNLGDGHGKPCCLECLSYCSSAEDPESAYPLLSEGEQRPCWCCVKMIEESRG